MGGLPVDDIVSQSNAEDKSSSRSFIKPYDPNQNFATQAVGNVPESALQLGSDMSQMILHPIQTAKSLYDLSSSIVNLFRGGEQGNEDIARAVGEFFKERYGGIDNIKKTFATDPLAVLADASIIITGGTALPARLGGTVGSIAKVANTAGKIIDPITQGVNVASLPLKAIAPAIQGATGVSSSALKTGYAAGQSSLPIPFVKSQKDKDFTDAMRGKIDQKDVVSDANKAFENMNKRKQKDFVDQKTKLQLDKKNIDFSTIENNITQWIDSKTYQGVSELSDNSQKILNNINKEIKIWSANKGLHNAKGLDMLKRKIDDMYPLNPNSAGEQMVVTVMKNIVKDQIIKQVPDYAKVMEAYETASLLAKELMQELSLGKTKNASTTLKKLQSIMRNNANTNYGARLQAFNKLDEFSEANILEKIAGMELNSWTNRGIKSVIPASAAAYSLGSGNLAALGILPFSSPRLTGEASRLFGKASNTVVPALQSSRVSGLISPTIEETQKGLLQ
tara:strand:+ start:912 stop:2432 length:1521 start_codon:yes stop_codon:yes gene_type:complete